MRRTLVVIMGVLGALAVFDAALLFVVLLFAGPSPYVGLLMFVAAPAGMVVGATLVWTSYRLLTHGRAPASARREVSDAA